MNSSMDVGKLSKFSNSFIEKYLCILDWENISIEKILQILDLTLEKDLEDSFNLCLVKLAELRLETMNKEMFLNVLTQLDAFCLKNKNNNNKEFYRGIFFYLEKVELTGKINLLKNFTRIKRLLLNLVPQISNLDEIVRILKMYFILGHYKHAKKIVKKLTQQKLKYNHNDINNYLDLLFISLVLKQDGLVVDEIENIEQLLDSSLPEVECYKSYYNSLENVIRIKETIDKIQELRISCTYINREIASEIFPMLISNLKLALIKTAEVITKVIVLEKSRTCPFDFSQLQSGSVYFIDYINRQKTYVEVELLFCPKCKKHFTNQDTKFDLEQTEAFKRVNKTTIQELRRQAQLAAQNYVASQKDETDEDILSLDKEQTAKFATESDLYKLGYNLELTRAKRKKILFERAIPQLGVEKVVSHISWLINSRSSQKKKYARAINEWNHDLKVIEQAFNSSYKPIA